MISHRFQCVSCGGQYSDHNLDGTTYHHVCGPLPADTNGVALPRPNARDENILTVRGNPDASIRAEGKGVKCLTSTKVLEPQWLKRMRATKFHDAKGAV